MMSVRRDLEGSQGKTRVLRATPYASLLLILSICSADAETVSERMTEASPIGFAQAFLGFCIQNNADPAKTLAVAQSLKLEAVPEEFKALVAPPDPSAEFHGFAINEGEGAPFLLGIVFSSFDGEEMASCTVANPYIDSKSVASALLEITEMETLVFDETQMGQRTRIWDTKEFVEGSMIILLDSEKMGIGGATLSFVRPVAN